MPSCHGRLAGILFCLHQAVGFAGLHPLSLSRAVSTASDLNRRLDSILTISFPLFPRLLVERLPIIVGRVLEEQRSSGPRGEVGRGNAMDVVTDQIRSPKKGRRSDMRHECCSSA